MLSTAVAILAALALLMPGFVIAELSAARSARSSRSDLELALRALAYTLVLHLAFGAWTAKVVREVGPFEEWPEHLLTLSAYVLVVLLAVPVTLGAMLNRYLAYSEGQGRVSRRAGGELGAGEARDAFDYAYQRWRSDGGYVIVD